MGGCVIVIDPFTGEILALANVPTFDPSNRKPGEARSMWNWGVSNLYEPGSTLKVITAAAALDSGAVAPHSVFYCPGRQKIGRHTVGCIIHRPFKGKHGSLRVEEIIQWSCNLGAAAIGRKAGYRVISDYLRRFGFGDYTGIDLPAEARGSVRSAAKKWPEISLANISFGQGLHVTALQLAMAYAVIANGGTLMKPLLIKGITDTKGKTVLQSFDPQPVRRVISAETARTLTGFMETVVEEGTGKTAKITGYTVAGKTGSAQKAEGKKGYVPGKYIASFAGFFPAKKPRYVMVAVLDEPKGTHWGATVAAPVFKALGERIALMQAVPEDDPESRLKQERKQARLYGQAAPPDPQAAAPAKKDRTGAKQNSSD